DGIRDFHVTGVQTCALPIWTGEPLDWVERGHLGWLAHEYGIEAAGRGTGELIEALLRRVDVVPQSLALAQAAKESGWGASRFAQIGRASCRGSVASPGVERT